MPDERYRNSGYRNSDFEDDIYQNTNYQGKQNPKYQKVPSKNQITRYYKNNQPQLSDNGYFGHLNRDYLQNSINNNKQNTKNKVSKRIRVMNYQE